MSKILLVEDDALLRERLRQAIESFGYDVVVAADGRDALAQCAAVDPDLIVSDVRMPELGGPGLVAALREAGDETPVVLLSHFGEIGAAREAMKAGAFHFITKPVDRDELQVLLARISGMPRHEGSITAAAEEVEAPGVIVDEKSEAAIAARGNHSNGEFLGELPEDRLPLRDIEREIVQRALNRFKGNKSKTARYLDVPRHVLLYRIEKYGI